ncbi:MAG: hypothetical protein ABIN20_09140 [candidate division WOR-3 bacterium]
MSNLLEYHEFPLLQKYHKCDLLPEVSLSSTKTIIGFPSEDKTIDTSLISRLWVLSLLKTFLIVHKSPSSLLKP